MIEHSKIYRGEVTHERLGPAPHAFRYPMTFFGFDLGELPLLASASALFGHNESRPLQFKDNDYLRGSTDPVAEQLLEFLPAPEADERTFLVTSPRYFGYAFNPVNFYLRLRGDQLTAALAEVNNTFGDRHIYPLPSLTQEGTHFWSARCLKDFHVSPFNNMEGEYAFSFRVTREDLFLGVDLYREGDCVMKTWIQGKAMPLTTGAILRYAIAHPFDTALNSMPRIVWQAARLYYGKKMAVYRRPSPESAQTLIDRDDKKRPGTVI